VNVRTASEEK